MQKAAPRLLIAGTNSGCGKTTVTCAILQALVDGGVSVAAAKCGPDYIDPMFHREIIGAKSSNLDPFFFDDDTLRFLLAQNGAGKDVTVIEGVMGYYDGIGLDSSRASTFEVAQRTESPVVLVLNAKGAGLSVRQWAPDGVIEGVCHSSLPVLAVQWHPERQSFALRREDASDGAAVFWWLRREAEKRGRAEKGGEG